MQAFIFSHTTLAKINLMGILKEKNTHIFITHSSINSSNFSWMATFIKMYITYTLLTYQYSLQRIYTVDTSEKVGVVCIY